MPSIDIPYVNVVLDTFGLIVLLIIFASCLSEYLQKEHRSLHFVTLLGLIIVAVAADIVSWLGEGHPEFALMTLISNTVASCVGQLAIICFMEYLCHMLYEKSRVASIILNIFRVLCYLSVLFSIGNLFYGYSFRVSETGHYVHSENEYMVVLHLLFSMLAFLALILMALFAKTSRREYRFVFIIYTVFPIVGIVLDYTTHGISLTYISLVVSALIIYTNIHIERQQVIESQKNALMLSQINPHFTYNTLTTIAAMCDSSPKTAKGLTIDFARYLRQNLSTMTSEELIPFDKELEHVECYLKIEKARFRDRLNVIYSIQCRDFVIPPLTVQPIVENAVKHGITKQVSGGTVKISTYDTEKYYVIEIIDDGVGFNMENIDNISAEHIGLANVESRVKRLCRGNFYIKSTVDVGTRVTIEIPHKKGRK